MKLKLIFFCFSLLTVFTTIGGLYFYYDSIKTAALNEDQIVSVSHVKAIERSVSQMILRYQRIALALSLHKELSLALVNSFSPRLDQANQILDLFNSSIQTDVCYLLNKKGVTIASSNRLAKDSFVGKNYAFRPYFKESIKGNPSVFMALGVTSGIRGIYFTSPVYECGTDAVIGVSVIKERVEKIENDILFPHYPIHNAHHDMIAITNKDGVVFISDHKEILYNVLWETDDRTFEKITSSRQFGKGPWNWAGFKRINRSKAVDKSNREYSLISVEIQDIPGWNIVHLSDTNFLLGRLKESFFKTTGYVFLFVFIIIGSALLILNNLAGRAEKALRESEQKYRSLFNQSVVGIYLHDLQGQILDVNHTACRQTGYSRDELVKMRVFDLHPDDTDTTNLKNHEILQHWSEWEPGHRINLEAEHQRRDGSIFPVEISTGVISYGNNRLILAVTKDITEKKQAIEDLSQIFTLLLDMICIADIRTSTFIKVNPAFTETLGYSEEEMLNKPFLDFIHPDDIESTRRVVETRLQMGAKVIDFENRYRCKDGSYLWLSWVSRPIAEKGKSYSIARDITDRKDAEENITSQNRLMSTLLDNLQVGVFMVEAPSGKPLLANKQAIMFLGRGLMNGVDKETLAEIYQAYKSDTDELYPEHEMPIVRGLMGEHHTVDDMMVVHPDGKRVYLQVFGSPVKDMKGNVIASLVSFSDITDQKAAEKEREKLQNQLMQSQKMESVGRLAGGVAHDFNNMLSIILGNAELILEDLAPDSPFKSNMKEIYKAAERSANLTRQLLAFARKQTVAPKVLDINEELEKMLSMLNRLIGEDITLNWHPGKNLKPIKIDPSQIDQIVANLCVNARDAIQGIGKVTIETKKISFDEEYCRKNSGFVPGDYIMIGISDNGSGMDQTTLNNLFEPFFTTKDVGQGSGLGLSTVYGIVKQNNGFINVYSEIGEGTIFKIYLPQYNDATVSRNLSSVANTAPKGNETILLVEDEEAILTMTQIMLEGLGYTVITAATPGEAVAMVKKSRYSSIHLLITDVVMPEMNGRDLSKKLIHLYPALKCLFMSGYTENVIAHHGVLDSGVNFINKPFSRQNLATKVRETLDEDKDNKF